jgi:hypothetical protein
MKKVHGLGIEGEQAMDGFCLAFGHFCEPLCRASGRGGQQDRFTHRAPQRNDRPRGERFPASRPTGEHQQTRRRRQFDCAALLCGEGNPTLLRETVDPDAHTLQVLKFYLGFILIDVSTTFMTNLKKKNMKHVLSKNVDAIIFYCLFFLLQ